MRLYMKFYILLLTLSFSLGLTAQNEKKNTISQDVNYNITYKNGRNINNKYNSQETPIKHELNPLGMIADYNLTNEGEFASGDVITSTGGYFTWEQAQKITVPEGYHIPNKGEAFVIFGEMNMDLGKDQPPYVQFTDEIDYTANETVTIWGEEGNYTCHFKAYANDICYAIRFIGEDNKYVSAFRWELLPSGGSVDEQFGPIRNIYGVKATCRLLGSAGKDMEINKVANEEYWQNNNENDVTKYFPAAGFCMTAEDDVESDGIRGRYWTTSKKINEEAGNFSGYGFGFDENWAFGYAWAPYSAFSLRCFKDNPYIADGIKEIEKNIGNTVTFKYDGISMLNASSTLTNICIYTYDGIKIFESNQKSDHYNVQLKKNTYIINYNINYNSTNKSIKFIVK